MNGHIMLGIPSGRYHHRWQKLSAVQVIYYLAPQIVFRNKQTTSIPEDQSLSMARLLSIFKCSSIGMCFVVLNTKRLARFTIFMHNPTTEDFLKGANCYQYIKKIVFSWFFSHLVAVKILVLTNWNLEFNITKNILFLLEWSLPFYSCCL